jgi:DNA-directed RNA polymerase specialized sigma24 family protein
MDWVHHAPTPANDLTPDEIKLAGDIVGGFVSTRPWLREEREDLVQECLEQWLRRRASYDATRGASLTTFMRRVLERHLLDIEEKRTAMKRGGGQAVSSLDDQDATRTSLLDSLGSMDDTEADALAAIALEGVRARLTPVQLVLADALISGWSMSDIARTAKQARSTLYLDLRRIREVFRDEGLTS